MDIVTDPLDLQSRAQHARAMGSTIGLVPTMGAFHEGHLSLIRKARRDCDLVVASVFVNPTQFGPAEDYGDYPRTLDMDAALARREGVDIVFAPEPDAMYPEGFQTFVAVGPIGNRLCGQSRPGHFRGVATIVLKLLNLVQPHLAYFGMKDYQQLKVIEQMVSDFDLATVIVPMPIVREADGLAMSSRNRYLTDEERNAARVLRRSLEAASSLWLSGVREPQALHDAVEALIKGEPMARVDYVEVVDPDTLEPPEEACSRILIALAVFVGEVRLIDNILLQ